MAGATSQALAGVRVGVEALQKAMTQIPMGSELHTALLKAIGDISKHVGEAQADPGATMQTLSNMARSQAAAPNQAALSRLMAQPQGPPGTPMAAAA